MDANNSNPVVNNDSEPEKKEPNFSLGQLFSLRWIRIFFVFILLVITFVLLRFISYQLLLLVASFLPLFIGFGLAYLVEPVVRFFQRFFRVKVSRAIVYFLLCAVIMFLVIGLFVLFFIKVDELYNSLISGRGRGEFKIFLHKLSQPTAEGGIDPNLIDSLTFTKVDADTFRINLTWISRPEEFKVVYEYDKTEVGGVYSLMFFLISNIPALKNVIFNLIRVFYGWNDSGYVEWLFNNVTILATVLYVFFFSLLITAFAMGRGERLYRSVWSFLTKGQAPTVSEKLKVELKRNMSAWLRGLLIDEMYIFSFTLFFLFLVGIIFRNNSSYFSNALMLALFMAIFNLIPYIGPWIGLALISSVGLVDSVSNGTDQFINWLPFILAAGGTVLVQIGESAIVAPLVYSHQVKLSPITIIMGLTIIGVLFGFFALPFAIPLILILTIVLRVVYQKEWNI